MKSLEGEITKQAVKVQTRKERMQRGKSKLQRDIENIDRKIEEASERADELRRKYDPNLMRIQNRYMSRLTVDRGTKGLVCPVCGRSDGECGHNKMNGKPWCIECKSPLVPKGKLKKWRKMAKIKTSRTGLKDEFKRRGLDF